MIQYVVDMKKSKTINGMFFLAGVTLMQCCGCAATSVAKRGVDATFVSTPVAAEHLERSGFVAVPPKQEGQFVNYIAARVQVAQDSDVAIILWDQLQQRARLTGKTWQEVRTDWIDELLMQGFLGQYGQQVTQQDVLVSVNRIQQQSGLNDEEFAKALRQVKGFTPQQHRDWVKRQMIRARYVQYVSSQSRVSDRKLAGALKLRSLRVVARQDKADMQESNKRMRDLIDKVNAIGELDSKVQRFQELAQQFCEQDAQAVLSGSQRVNLGHLLQEFEQAVATAVAGSVVGPVYSRGGWHVILVEQRCPVAGHNERGVDDEHRQVDFVVQRAMKKLRRTAFIREYNAS